MAAMFAWGVIATIVLILCVVFYAIPKWLIKKAKSWKETRFLRGYFFTPMFSNTKLKFKHHKTLRRYLL